MTIKEAFQAAKAVVESHHSDIYTCCCAHDHDESCEMKKIMEEDPETAHKKHNFGCSCPDKHQLLHSSTCHQIQSFEANTLKQKFEINSGGKKYVCCCGKDIKEHGEANKFIFESTTAAQNAKFILSQDKH